MADNHQQQINRGHIWQGIPTNSRSFQTITQSVPDSGATRVRYAANVTKADFNRDINVDVRSISGERIQARHYEVPEAIAVNENENKEVLDNQLIVDAQPLPWYIRIDFWKLCVIAIMIVSAFVVVIVLLSTNLSSTSSSSNNQVINFPKGAPTNFPSLPTHEPSLKPSIPSTEEYIAMQRDILEQYYIETDGEYSWDTTENWLNDDVSVCKWFGCVCNGVEDNIITSFHLRTFTSPQEVPTVIGMLSKLEILTIDGANIVGTLPSELFLLHGLKQMTISSSLEGTLPSEIGDLRSLEILEIRGNSFDGQIPTELGLMRRLTRLDIKKFHSPFVEASIPSEIGNLSSLKTLYMSGNSLRGALPAELFSLVSLEDLNLSRNRLSGSLPLSMDLMSLREVDLSSNLFTGMLPGALVSLESLEVLHMDVSCKMQFGTSQYTK